MTYSEAIAYFETLSRFGEKLGLVRMERLRALAGHPEEGFPSVLVGGTNGKGSTGTMLGAILQAAGYRVGTAPKPHLHTHRERLQIDGAMIEEQELADLVAEVQPWVAEVAADARLGQPTVFEVITLLSFLHFARHRVDWAVVEVGLGGRFDATNVLPPRLSVITNIGLDHTDRLGETLEAIAFEKSGILRPGRPAITGATGAGLSVIEARATELGTPLWRLGEEIVITDRRVSSEGSRFDLSLPGTRLTELSLRMVGAHQVENAAVAVAAALQLRDEGGVIPDAAIRSGLATAVIPGRLEVREREPLLLLDAAHNPDGARSLARALRDLFLPQRPGRRLLLVLAVSQIHEPAEVIGALVPLADRTFATASRHPLALPAREVGLLSHALLAESSEPRPEITVVPNVPDAVSAARSEARPDDVICVTGSIFALGEVPI